MVYGYVHNNLYVRPYSVSFSHIPEIFSINELFTFTMSSSELGNILIDPPDNVSYIIFFCFLLLLYFSNISVSISYNLFSSVKLAFISYAIFFLLKNNYFVVFFNATSRNNRVVIIL